MNEAKPVTVGLSQEVLDINFSMQLVRVARITGHVLESRRHAGDERQRQPGAGQRCGGRGNQIGMNFGGRIQWDGAFTITNVPPGRYMLRARGDDSMTPLFGGAADSASTARTSAIVTVVLSAGATITGTVVFLPGAVDRRRISTQIRISAPSTDQSDFGPQPNARVDKDGRFTLAGVSAGSHLIRPGGNMRGWVLKSVTDRRPRRHRHAGRAAQRRDARQRRGRRSPTS